jgi:microcystin-dependent protein
MAGEVVYRLLQGPGIQIVEDSGTRTATISVPGLDTKLNVGDIGQATQLLAGIAKIATTAEVRAGTNPDNIVTPAGLSAASQASLDDATAARLMRVGGFGLGGAALTLTSENLNVRRATGFYYCVTCTNGPISNSAGGDGWLLHRDHSASGYASQIYDSGVTDRMFFRRQVAGAWSAWRELYHTANFDPTSKANTSGNYPGIIAGNSAQVGNQTAEMLAPPGMIAHFAMWVPPTGWLAANGAAVSRATYAALFAAIGTTYGAGNGSSTFNLPDLRGMFHRTWDNGRGLDPNRAFGTSQSSANLAHSHSGGTDFQGAHVHTIDGVGNHNHNNGPYQYMLEMTNTFTMSTNDNSIGEPNLHTSGAIQPAGAHTHSMQGAGGHSHNLSINADGAGESRPINIALLACIKT